MPFIETGLVPDIMLRYFIRQRIRSMLKAMTTIAPDNKQTLITKFKASPIAIHPELANEQHYEVPPTFFQQVLGSRLKYSSCYWPEGTHQLDEAETAMLELTCHRARVEDGHTILDLGCGWGALSLWLAKQYPNSCITAVSNARSQREFIQTKAREHQLTNLTVHTSDINDLELEENQYDRVISIEMFEHMKNYSALLSKIATWLQPGGLLFVHHFSHRQLAYEFDHTQPDNWMARTFFAGGTMPSDDLLMHFAPTNLQLLEHWQVNGTHYEKTLNAWLAKMDAAREDLYPILQHTYGTQHAARWWVYWRLFFMACAETFGLNHGTEYLITHQLWQRSV